MITGIKKQIFKSSLIGATFRYILGLGLTTIVIVIDSNQLHFLCDHNHNCNHTFSKLDVIVIILCNHLQSSVIMECFVDYS